MIHKAGDRVFWRSVNQDCSGTVVGFRGPFAIVRPDNSEGVVLIQNEPYEKTAPLLPIPRYKQNR